MMLELKRGDGRTTIVITPSGHMKLVPDGTPFHYLPTDGLAATVGLEQGRMAAWRIAGGATNSPAMRAVSILADTYDMHMAGDVAIVGLNLDETARVARAVMDA